MHDQCVYLLCLVFNLVDALLMMAWLGIDE
jgi:hypothetical protein